MKKVISALITILVVFIILAASLVSLGNRREDKPMKPAKVIATAQQEQVGIAPQVDINSLPLQDNPDIYANDDPYSVITMYVTVRKGNSSDNTDNTWSEVKHASKYLNVITGEVNRVPKAAVLFQVGDENGPTPGSVGYNEKTPNGTIQVRGNSSSLRELKSFKIVLNDKSGGWRGQYTIALNKHFGDPTKIRNKLSFDLIKEIPDMVSLRTQFVHLYVKDETGSRPEVKFSDYGLFTQIEQPNTTFLRHHYLDPNAQFYKATFFEFNRYADRIKLVTDSTYDEKLFESRLEVKGNKNHIKLIEMIEAVNNPAIPIEKTFEYYFNADNYFTWMAFNILIGNIDVSSQNFFLYSPQNSHTWYFLPWDYDGTFSRLLNREIFNRRFEPWQQGIATFWGSTLHRRVLTIPEYRNKLDKKVEFLYKVLSEDKINGMVVNYREAIKKYLQQMPDFEYLNEDAAEFGYSNFYNEITNNYKLYKETLKQPMPFFLGEPVLNKDGIIFTWQPAYDLSAQDITYTFKLSKDPAFASVLVQQDKLIVPQASAPIKLEPGEYFWQVIASNTSGQTQYAFNNYVNANKTRFYGTEIFNINPDGTLAP